MINTSHGESWSLPRTFFFVENGQCVALTEMFGVQSWHWHSKRAASQPEPHLYLLP